LIRPGRPNLGGRHRAESLQPAGLTQARMLGSYPSPKGDQDQVIDIM
jgi:hypothetical protein